MVGFDLIDELDWLIPGLIFGMERRNQVFMCFVRRARYGKGMDANLAFAFAYRETGRKHARRLCAGLG